MCEDLVLNVGDVVEFCGTDESSKTQVLSTIIANCILPKVVSGCEFDIILISTDHKFDIVALVRVLEQKLKLSACNSDRTFLDSILDRFHLFQATSVSDCCMVLSSLLHFPRMYGKIGAVIIDDVGILSWENKTCTKKEPKLADCADIIKKLVQESEILMILNQFSPLSDGYHVKPWVKLVTCRFKLYHYFEGIKPNTKIQQLFPDSGKVFKFIHF